MKITFVGGGSYAWTPRIVTDMLQTPGLAKAQYVLFDINKKASDLTKAALERYTERLGISADIISTDNQTHALQGADYVVITISTGGLAAMSHDLAIAEKFGIYHTVGDTCGPGGWSRTIRNFDVFANLGRACNKLCPNAVILNYTNPMIMLTDILSRVCHAPVIGLCHALFENLAFFKQFYKLQSEDDIAVKYAGINHFCWITEAKTGTVDVMRDLTRRLKTTSFTDLRRSKWMDAEGFSSSREVATELFRQTGAMPFLGDRHTCEWFSRYITNRAAMKKYKIVRTTIADRIQRRKRHENSLKKIVNDGWTAPIKRSRETAADIINAHSQGRAFIDVGNVPNIGQVSNLPLGAIVETAVRIDRNGFSPIAFGALPEPVHAIIEPWCRVLTMVVDALFKKDLRMAKQALRLDPICAGLNDRQVDEMGNQLLRAHRKYISAF